ncbi:MAG: Na/Pi cotransporter family protein [Firmicutes bacterium]|nr:Na/Pi cotransporter family protein [Bacillota bacterium]
MLGGKILIYKLILHLLVGIFLFILGIKILSSYFKKIATKRFKNIICNLTQKKIIGVFIGIFITALIQSSSATTVIVISLVHSGLLSLYSSVAIIMGANIGTTVTGQLIAFEVSNQIKYLLLICFILLPFYKNKIFKSIIIIFFSLSLIFLGINSMSSGITNLNGLAISNVINYLSNNFFLSISFGMFSVFIIHSSSTALALLQIMTSTNMIKVTASIPIILGFNLGTCIDAILGSLATNKLGKQAAFIHLIYNFLGIILILPFIDIFYRFIRELSPGNYARQIANFHSLFNIFATILILPFSNFLVKLSKFIIKD